MVHRYPMRIEAMLVKLEFSEKLEDIKPGIRTLEIAIDGNTLLRLCMLSSDLAGFMFRPRTLLCRADGERGAEGGVPHCPPSWEHHQWGKCVTALPSPLSPLSLPSPPLPSPPLSLPLGL